MKRHLNLFILLAVVGAVIVTVNLIPRSAPNAPFGVNEAGIFGSSRVGGPKSTSVGGFTDAIVCSSFVNDPNANKTLPYAQVIAPTGYWFDRIDVCNAQANAAQTVAIRFWASATDSTSLNTDVTTIYLASGGAEVHSFPIRCNRVSLTLIADTDDVYVIGYTAK